MNTQTTFTQSLSFFHHSSLLLGLLFLLLSAIGQAADLTFTPTAPIVEVGKQITLSVSGTSGEVTWTVAKGQIQGTGAQVTYVAPAQVGLDVVTVMDGEGNVAMIKIVVISPSQNQMSINEAIFHGFTNRSHVTALLFSEDDETLWVGTWGGVEQRNANTGEIKQVLMKSKSTGLPDNYVTSLWADGTGGLWIQTKNGDLVRYYADGHWEVSTTSDSELPAPATEVSDGKGGRWIIEDGLTHYYANGRREVFAETHLGPPDNRIPSLLVNSRGLWVGTVAGLAHSKIDGQSETWEIFTPDNSKLPEGRVWSLLDDDNGGVWIGTGEGLAHYFSNGQWEVFTVSNSKLPNNYITSLTSDDSGGLWVGTADGLAHYQANGLWEIFTTANSELPSNEISSMLTDDNGRLWIGTYGGLAHLNANGQWQIFTTNNSMLPGDWIHSFLADERRGGIWVGTSGGLARYSGDGQWEVFTIDNSKLPVNNVWSLLKDGKGGLWVGTVHGGLAHYDANDLWEVFTTANSGLPDDLISSLFADGSGGLWIGTHGGGLSHLTFTQKTALCQTTDTTTCENLQATKRAAILIAGGGADSTNTLWDTTESITNYLYKVFNKRGFDNDEIYYLSPKSWADFNGDGIDDRIVDAPKPERPLTPEDVRLALEWAKGLGKLDQPLYLFFVDHGGTEKFQISKMEYLEVTTLKTWLDDYQTVTGNQVMMVIDACYSGRLLETLKVVNRAIISSTGDGLAYFERTDKRGFSRFFATGLLKGMNFWEAFDYAGGEQTKLLGDISKLVTASSGAGGEIGQVPQFYDGSDPGKWLKQIYLNGSFTAGDLTLAVESLTSSTALTVGTPLSLKAKAILAEGQIERVWAVLRPPKMNLVMDSNGTPILVLPRLALTPSKSEKEIWETTWQEAMYNGDYQVTFYAEDNQGTIASSDLPVVITVTGGIDPPPQALVQLGLEKTQYHAGERFTATLTEHLSWGYDLYAAVILPDGQTFVTLKTLNEFAPLNQPKPWRARRVQTQPVPWIDMTLPDSLPTGQYCLFGILSPEGGDVFETLSQGLWVMETKCFEMF